MNFVQDLGAVVTLTAIVTDANGHMLEDNPTTLVSENFSLYEMLSYLALAVFASVAACNTFLFFIRSHGTSFRRNQF
jgi:hypothetical protein